MKYALIALAATAISGAAASHNHRRHNHAQIFKRNPPAEACVCSTYVTSYVVAVTAAPEPTTTVSVVPVFEAEPTTTVFETDFETTTTVVYETATVAVPTPDVSTYETPGVYTIPAKTVTLTESETAIIPKTTELAPGPNTYGGVTTTVDVETTITVPVVVPVTTDDVTTSVISSTVYVCPTPGPYTIGASTTTATEPETLTYGVPTVYAPGTYVQPEVTTTITKTLQVVTCPYSVIATPTPAPVTPQKETPEEEKPKAETPKAETPKYETPKVETPKVETPKVETPKVETPKHETPKVVTPKVETPKVETPKVETPKTPKPSTGKHYGITYSPYSDNGGCKDKAAVYGDIADIASKGFANVRIYSTDCSSLEYVGSATEKHGLGLILGIFIKAGGVSTGAEQLAQLKKFNGWSRVKSLIVGNEAVFNGFCTAGELAGFIKTVKKELSGVYSGPVSTTETLNILQAHGSVLCPAMDFVGINIQPYFDGGVTADKAGAFLASQLALAEKVCGGKQGYVLEAGWPSAGNPNGKAVASPSNQAAAIKGYEQAAPGRVTFFTYRNDLWKEPGNLGIETKFGCGQVFK